MPSSLTIIAFGANLGDRHRTFEQAMQLLAQSVGPVLKTSSLIETAPLVLPGEDPGLYPAYLNAVCTVQTELDPLATLQQMLRIEQQLGRIREKRWASRTVDLDLIAHGDSVLASSELTLPHPEMHKRSFVLEPLLEIYPEWRHPLLGLDVRGLMTRLAG